MLPGLYGAEHKTRSEKQLVLDEEEEEENEYLEKLAHWKRGGLMIYFLFNFKY